MNKDFPSLVNFLIELEKYKTILRDTKTLDKRKENDAEHSWHLAMFVLLFEDKLKEEKLDISKMLKFAILHDLPEIYTGDLNPYLDDLTNKDKDEKESFDKLMSILSDKYSSNMLDLMKEYKEQKSKESRVVRAMDKLLPLISGLANFDSEDVPSHHEYKITKEMVYSHHKRLHDDEFTQDLFMYIYEECINKNIFYNNE